MLKEFVDYLVEMAVKPKERVVDIHNKKMVVDKDGQFKEVKPNFKRADAPIYIHTLSGLVDYVKSSEINRDTNETFFINIVDENKVKLIRYLDEDGQRDVRLVTEAIVPEFEFNRFFDTESLIIKLQAMFVETEHLSYLKKVVGKIKSENVSEFGDDGVSQKVVIKSGVASVSDAAVPNPVTLAPYRTFIEVPQPESEFVFRMKDGPSAALFESDGGAWRNTAISNIQTFLAKELEKEIEEGTVQIIA